MTPAIVLSSTSIISFIAIAVPVGLLIVAACYISRLRKESDHLKKQDTRQGADNQVADDAASRPMSFPAHVHERQVAPPAAPQTVIITQRDVENMTGDFIKGKYILIADDQEMNLLLLDKILTRWQCRFDKAADGVVAYELFLANQYDLVLLDLQMPRMTGIEVIKKIRADKDPQKALIPVLALTSDVTMPGNEAFLLAGFNAYLLKPFREKDIYYSVIKHLLPVNVSVKL